MQTSSRRLRPVLGLALLGTLLVACSDDSSSDPGAAGSAGTPSAGASGTGGKASAGASGGAGKASAGSGGTGTQGQGGTGGTGTQGQGGSPTQGQGGQGTQGGGTTPTGTGGQGTQGGGSDPQGEGGQGTQGGGSDPQGEGGQGTQGGGSDPQGGSPGTGGTGSSSDDDGQYCVDKINAYRATLGLPALARWADAEVCSDGEAKSDSESGKPHGAFGTCGESAQNECPGWPGPVKSLLDGCLQMMWDEGPGEDFQKHGHYLNMSSTGHSKVACGFHQTSSGSYWAVQNFR